MTTGKRGRLSRERLDGYKLAGFHGKNINLRLNKSQNLHKHTKVLTGMDLLIRL